MVEYNYCDEIKNKYKIEELNSLTLSTRINGFINACGMNLENSICTKEISPTLVPYINKKRDDDRLKYNINFANGYDTNGKYFILLGKYNDLDFVFKNYFEKDRNKEKINELPFMVSINMPYNEYLYVMDIETVKGSKTKFSITKRGTREGMFNQFTFYSNIKDFEKILKIIEYFKENPEIVFITYNEVMKEKEVVFKNRDINTLIDANNKKR